MDGVAGASRRASWEQVERPDDELKCKSTCHEPRQPDWSTGALARSTPLPIPVAPKPPEPVAAKPVPVLPVAANAMRGVTIEWLAANVPKTDRVDLTHSFTAGDYRLHPQMQKQADGSEGVAYWTAFNVRTKRAEFFVGPEAVATFARETERYVDAAARSTAQGMPTRPYEIESQRVTQAMMQEGVGAGFEQLGHAWGAALRDHEWWTKTILNTVTAAGPAIASRAVAPTRVAGMATPARAATEATPVVSQTTRMAAAASAKRLVATAQVEEPRITQAVRSATESRGGNMVGLEARLKTEESLTRKIATDAAAEGETVDVAAGNVKDAVRYTASFDAAQYGRGYRNIMSDLKAQGYEMHSLKNTWSTDGYRGINASLKAPSGQTFELQFHTPESFAAKTEVHGLYEKWRAPGTSVAQCDALSEEMAQRFRVVPIPPGAIDVGLLESLSRRGIGIIVPATENRE